jgi:hypothetical protein
MGRCRFQRALPKPERYLGSTDFKLEQDNHIHELNWEYQVELTKTISIAWSVALQILC